MLGVTTIYRSCFEISRGCCFYRCWRLATEMFSGSESESWLFRWTRCFLFNGAMSFSISFRLSTNIFAKSDIISFLKDVFISFNFSGFVLGDLLELAIRFSAGLFSVIEASKSPDSSSATAFLFWLLVVNFQLKNRVFGKRCILRRKFWNFYVETTEQLSREQ